MVVYVDGPSSLG